MKEKILRGVLVILVIASLTINNFLLIGLNVAEAVNENLENQEIALNSYVDYDVYFKEGDKKVHSIEASTKEGTSLYINVNVKDTGVALDAGKIKIENSNFKIGKVKSTAIKSINYETKEIELNEIIYGNNVEIELPITFEKNENIEVVYFDAINTVKLEGEYRKKETSKEVKAERKVELKWTEKAEIEVEEKVEKYLKVEQGIILQEAIEVKVKDNVLPKQREKIEIEVPEIEEEKPSKVTVMKNGKVIEEAKYDEEAGTLKIETENKIWTKGKDEYKVIYTYYGIEEASRREVKLNTKVETKIYSQEEVKTKENKETVEIEEKGNIASVKEEITEEQYKGYMYAGAKEETEYEEISTVEVSYKEEKEIVVELGNDSFVDERGTKYSTKGSTYYKETIIDKNEVLKVFGENAYLEIKNENGELIKYIDKDVETDKNGNIVIKYGEPTEKITIKADYTEKAGSLKVYSKKAIKGQTGYTKGELKQVTGLVSEVKLKEEEKEVTASAEMKLKETQTDAEIILSQMGLSTLNENNVKIDVNLKTDNNKYDLYKNPTIEIKLPEEVVGVEINSVNQLYKKQLSLKEYKYNEETKTIRIEYEGEQTEFGNTSNEGMFIEVDAKIRLNKLATTKASEIVMTYTNENGEENTYEKKVDVNINSKAGILTYTSVSGYNEEGTYVEALGSEIAKGKLEEQSSAKVATAKVAIINNYDAEVEEVEIIGTIPEKEEKSTFITTLAGGIKTTEGTKLYYSEDGQNWKEEIEDLAKVRKYKVVPNNNKIESKEALIYVYEFNIPSNLAKGEETYTSYEVKYKYAGQEVRTTSRVILSTEVKEKSEKQEEIVNVAENSEEYEGKVGKAEGIELSYVAITNGKELKEGEKVKEGQTVKYIVKAKNVSGKDINNFKLIAEQTNATFYGEEIVEAINIRPEPAYNRYVDEDKNLKNKEFTKEILKTEEEYEISYEFTVNNVGEGQKTEGKIKVITENNKEQEVKLNANEIEEGKLKLILKSGMTEDWEFTSKEFLWPLCSKITNLDNKPLRNITVKVPLQDWVSVSTYEICEAMEEDDKYTLVNYADNVITFNIEEIDPNEEIDIVYPVILIGMDSNKESELFRLNYMAYVQDEEDIVYTSNEIQKEVKQANRNLITIEQTSDKDNNEILEENEEVTFNAVIKNEGIAEKEITITDTISENFEIVDAYYEFNGRTVDLDIKENTKETIGPDERIKITVKAKAINTEDVTRGLSNEFGIETDNMCSISNPIRYRVASAVNNIEQTNVENYYNIEGIVWEDTNKNGIKDDINSNFEGIKTYLLDATTGNVVNETTTEENGKYDFTSLSSGKYIVAFDYDSTKYRTTTYKKTDVIEENNSNVISKEVKINGETKKLAVTDIIEITDESISKINAGFIEKEKVDFKLDKYVTKVTLQNNKGTTVKEYKNTKLAKLEINPKEIDKTLVLIEYAIDVTNEGELEGYVGEILDYIPNDLKFSSEINKDWYVTADGTLHNIALANDKLGAGETKQVKLILTKTMTKENMGLIINSAEIGKASNEYDIEDIDSTPSNKVDGEDDLSKAEVIISLTTGKEIIIIISTTLIALIITGLVIKIVRRKEVRDE